MGSELRTTPAFDVVLSHVRDRLPDTGYALVLIDGASGTGKTTLATHLADSWPANRSVSVVHMDDLYDGWQGLRAGMRLLADTIVSQFNSDTAQRLPRFDWSRGAYAEGELLPTSGDVIVEGCGSFIVPEDRPSTARIWLEGDIDIRRERALSRGGEGFDQHWSEWEEQFDAYVRDTRPAVSASIRVQSNR